MESLVVSLMETDTKTRTSGGYLLDTLLIRRAVEPDLVKKCVLEKLVETAVDMVEVIPNFWDLVAEIFCPSFNSAALPLTAIKDSANLLPSDKMVGDFLSALLNKMADSGKMKTHKAWRDSGLKWTEMVSASVNLEAFLEANNLRWLRNTGVEDLQAGQATGFAKELLDLKETAFDDNLVDSDEESDDERSDVEEEDKATQTQRN